MAEVWSGRGVQSAWTTEGRGVVALWRPLRSSSWRQCRNAGASLPQRRHRLAARLQLQLQMQMLMLMLMQCRERLPSWTAPLPPFLLAAWPVCAPC
jgi:hypothetical protein